MSTTLLKMEQRRIQRLIDLTGDNELSENRGVLTLDKRGNSTYCYEKTNQEKKYLGKSDSEAVRSFVMNQFLLEKQRRLLLDQGLLTDLEQAYMDYSYGAVMTGLPASYGTILKEDFNNKRYEELKQWAGADFVKNEAPFPDAEIYLKDGRRVRSKGECLHGNILLDLGVPFRYDSVITITDEYGSKKRVSPDFLIQCFSRRLIIIEHLGRLFDKRYGLDFGEKCYWYLQAGFILGRNFFVTSDDISGGTDSRAIWEVAKTVSRLFFEESLQYEESLQTSRGYLFQSHSVIK